MRLLFIVIIVTVVACRAQNDLPETATMPSLEAHPFGVTADGAEVDLYTLTNSHGMSLSITNYGGVVTRLIVSDRHGNLADIVLGYDSLAQYERGSPYFGAIVGRYGNRIARGRFALDGVEYALATNNGENHLHGGLKGFDKVVWDAESYTTPGEAGLRLSYVSADGEEGYPGRLQARVTYALTEENELRIEYHAETDEPTVVNLTHHGYFNLEGHASGNVLDHELALYADAFTPIDAGLIPTGEVRSAGGTPLDFSEPTAIGARIGEEDEQLHLGSGYDHNFVLSDHDGSLRLAARVYEPTSGRVMEVLTTEPGIQFYSGNFLDGSNIGKGGTPYRHRSGFCLETQHFPDSPNQSGFPSTVLRPGEKYATTTIYRYSTR